MSITLSLEPLDNRLPGYQAPLHESLVQPWDDSLPDPDAGPSSPPDLSQLSGSQLSASNQFSSGSTPLSSGSGSL